MKSKNVLLVSVSAFFLLFACSGSNGSGDIADGGGADTSISGEGGTPDASAHDAAAHDSSTQDAASIDASSIDAASSDAAADAPPSDADAECRHTATGNACVSCCANKYPSGLSELNLVGSNCMCKSCSASCLSTCDPAPKSPCIACVKQSLGADCPSDPDWTMCSTSCHEYVSCVRACAD